MSSPKDLQIYFLPFIAPGHLLPMLDMALSFSHHTPNISLLIPHSSSPLLPPLLPSPLRLIVLETDTPSPSSPASSVSAASLESTLASLFDPLRAPLDLLLQRRPPSCLVFDMFLPFAAECARARNVPSLVFHGTSFFALCVSESIGFTIECSRARDDDDNRPFIVPGLPDSIVLRPSQVPGASAAPLMKRLRESDALSYGAVFNSFYELEPAYAEHYRTRVAHRAWHVGPLCLFRADECDELLLSWLGSKEPGSVVYACFGSMSRFSRTQLEEIASGLVTSGRHFMWAARNGEVEEEMLAGHDKGVIARGWVAQMAILRHPAIGGFVTHCGWNSVIEGLCAGVPLVTWPLFAEQFFNERMVVDVLRVGVAVGATKWGIEEEEVVAGEALRGAVERVMSEGGEAEGMQGRAREIGEAARRAVREGGSSHADLRRLMNELVEVNLKRG